MKKIFGACIAMVMAIAMACIGLAGCSSTGSSSSSSDPIAATVNDSYNITEQQVTDYIDAFRSYASLTDDEAWAEWLGTYGYTASDVRDIVIKYFAQNELVKEACADKGITVSSDTIDQAITEAKSQFDTDDAWQSYLSEAGYTEDAYRDAIELYYLEQQLQEQMSVSTATDSELLQYASYYAGKKSSDILCKWEVVSGDDAATAANKQAAYEKAQGLIQQLNDGADFATLATANSDDSTAAAAGGNVGWDCLNSFVTAYTDALDSLSADQYSTEPVEDDTNNGYHIIKCTQVFAPTDTTTAADIPSEIKEYLNEGIASMNKSSVYESYVSGLVSSANIQIADMPSGLSYDIEPVTASTSTSTSTTTTTTSATTSTASTSTTSAQ